MHLFKYTNLFDLVVNTYVTQLYHLKRKRTAKTVFSTCLVIGPSRDRFAIDWFEMSGRRDVVKNFETGGLVQIEQYSKQQVSEFLLAHLLFVRGITGNQWKSVMV